MQLCVRVRVCVHNLFSLCNCLLILLLLVFFCCFFLSSCFQGVLSKMMNGRIQDNSAAVRNKGGFFKSQAKLKMNQRKRKLLTFLSTVFSPPVIDYELIALKNHRRKLEFFMQKGNCIYSGSSNLILRV